MVTIRWTDEAEFWLQDIFAHITKYSVNTANSVIQGIYHRAQILLKYPRIGQWYRLSYEGNIRILLYGHYRIVYVIKTEEKIDILGVFHDAMDLDKHLP